MVWARYPLLTYLDPKSVKHHGLVGSGWKFGPGLCLLLGPAGGPFRVLTTSSGTVVRALLGAIIGSLHSTLVPTTWLSSIAACK